MLQITPIPLDDLIEASRNPRTHDLAGIIAGLRSHGLVEPLIRDQRTGRLVGGHGRTEALRVMRSAGEPPPDGVTTTPDGRWVVPVVDGWASVDDAHAEAILVSLNQLSIAAGWDPEGLVDLLVTIPGVDVDVAALGFGDLNLDEIADTLGVVIGDPTKGEAPPAETTTLPPPDDDGEGDDEGASMDRAWVDARRVALATTVEDLRERGVIHWWFAHHERDRARVETWLREHDLTPDGTAIITHPDRTHTPVLVVNAPVPPLPVSSSTELMGLL